MSKLFIQVERVEDLIGRADDYFTQPKRKPKPITNADRIRAMTDEELAKLFDSWIQDCDCNDLPCHKSCEENSVSGCINHWLVWLKQGANDE